MFIRLMFHCCFKTLQVKWRDAYEPYVVLKTSEMPRYEPALLERMGDKIAYGLHLYAKGYVLLTCTCSHLSKRDW